MHNKNLGEKCAQMILPLKGAEGKKVYIFSQQNNDIFKLDYVYIFFDIFALEINHYLLKSVVSLKFKHVLKPLHSAPKNRPRLSLGNQLYDI